MLAKTGLCMSILAIVAVLGAVSCTRTDDRCPKRVPLLFLHKAKLFRPYLLADRRRGLGKIDPVLALGHVALQMTGKYSDILSTLPKAWKESLEQKSFDGIKEPNSAAWYIAQLFCTVHELLYCKAVREEDSSSYAHSESCLFFLRDELEKVSHILFMTASARPGYVADALRHFNAEQFSSSKSSELRDWGADSGPLAAWSPSGISEYLIRSGILFRFLLTSCLPANMKVFNECVREIVTNNKFNSYLDEECRFVQKWVKPLINLNAFRYHYSSTHDGFEEESELLKEELYKYLDNYYLCSPARMRMVSGSENVPPHVPMIGSDYDD